MILKFHVPTLQDEKSAQEIKDTILTSEPNAAVKIDRQAKVVSIDSAASEEAFSELIIAAGYSAEPPQ